MITSTKLPLLLFLCLRFLASVSSAVGYSLIRVNSQSDQKQCFIHCEEQYGGDPQSVGQLVCEEICVLKELKRHQGDRGLHEGGNSGHGGSNTESPDSRREYKQCKQQERDQQQHCQQLCEKQLRERESQQGGRGGETWRDPEEQHKQCVERCDRLGGTAQQRQLYKRMCGQTTGQDHGDGVDNVDTSQPYDKCWQECQRQTQDTRELQRSMGRCGIKPQEMEEDDEQGIGESQQKNKKGQSQSQED